MSVDEKTGFVSLTSLRGQTPDPQQALAEIRRIYFNTTRQTIQNDLAHAIELLKSLPQRAKVTVLHISHSRHEADQLGEWIFRLQDGRVEVIKGDLPITAIREQK